MKIYKEISNVFHKGLLFILSFILLMTSSFFGISAVEHIKGGYGGEWNGPVPYVGDGTLIVDTSVGWSLGGSSYGQEGLMTINGKVVYCLERQKSYYNGMSYVGIENDFSRAGISANTAKKLSLLAYFGKQRAINESNNDWHAIVGSAIWAELGEGKGWIESPSFPDEASVKAGIQTLQNDVANYYILPSFEGTNQSIKIGETIRITDTNNVLNTYKIVATNGLVAEIEGNDLIITATKESLENSKITFQKKISAADTGTSILYDAGDGVQKIGSFRIGDPIGGKITFDVQKYGELEITKTDKNNELLNGATVNVKSSDGTYNQNHVVKDGKITISDLEPKEYIVKEIIAPNGYLLNNTEFKINIEANQTAKLTIIDDVPTGTITMNKKDAETGNNFQGDASLAGAEYALYAKEDIYNVDHTVKIYDKDQIVAKRTTNSDGSMENITNLALGKYYIKETKAPSGYLLDNQSYDISLTYKDQNTAVILGNQEFKDTVMKQAFSIIKVSSDGSSTQIPTLQGAEFTVKLLSEVNTIGWDTAKTYDVLTTDSKGYALSKELPYGTYLVRETVTPPNVSPARDFNVTINKDSREPQAWKVINDAPFKTYIKMIKKDAASGKIVALAGAKFKIKNIDTGEYLTQKIGVFNKIDVFETDETGMVSTPLMVEAGNYQLEEILSPEGYLLNNAPVPFKITNQGAVDLDPDGDPVFTVVLEDIAVKGKITIQKFGEVLVDYVDNNFVYESRGLSGAVYNIIANADILDPADQSVLYVKDQLIETVTTNEKGIAQSSKLFLGDYRVEEISAPYGYMLSNNPQKVSLEYADQTVDLVEETITFVNERQKVHVDVEKYDLQSNESLLGAEISLFANRNIYNFDGDIIVKAGELLETVLTDGINKKAFSCDLPNDLTPKFEVMPLDELEDTIDTEFNNIVVDGVKLVGDPNSLFLVKETKAPDGYSNTSVNYYVDTSYTNQEEDTLEFSFDIFNGKTKIVINKVDSSTKIGIPNTDLALYKMKEDETIEEPPVTIIRTDADGKAVIEGLEIGKYVLRETGPNYELGYVTAQDMLIEVIDIAEDQIFTMEDDYTDIIINKIDSMTEIGIPNTELSLYPINEKGFIALEPYKTVVTDEHGQAHLKYIPVGKYILRETGTNFDLGYVTANDIAIEVKDTSQTQSFIMKDDHTEINIYKKNVNGEIISDAILSLVALDENGNEAPEPYATWISGNTPETLTYIPAGTYRLYELMAPDGFIKAQPLDIVIEDTAEIQDYVILNKMATVSKLDIGGNELPGAYLQVTDKITGEVIDEWISTNEPHKIKGLTEGQTVIITETLAPEGYEIANSIEFTVSYDKVNQHIKMIDQPKIGTVIFNNENMQNGKTTGTIFTGDNTNIVFFILIGGLSILAFLKIRKGEKEDEKESCN